MDRACSPYCYTICNTRDYSLVVNFFCDVMVIFLNVSKNFNLLENFLHIASTWGFHDNFLSIIIPNAVDLVVKEITEFPKYKGHRGPTKGLLEMIMSSVLPVCMVILLLLCHAYRSLSIELRVSIICSMSFPM